MISLNWLLNLTFLFLALQDCTIMVGSQQQLYIAVILIVFFLSIFCLFDFKNMRRKAISFFRRTPFKYLVFYALFLTVSGLYFINNYAYIAFRVFIIFYLTAIGTCLFVFIVIPKYLSYKRLLKFFVTSSYLIMLWGIFDFIYVFIFEAKSTLYYFLCSRHFFGLILHDMAEDVVLNRATSIFFEPSFFATFIFLFLPLSYLVFKSNLKIYKNKNINFLVKKTIPFLFWINLLLTKSPIYIIIAVLFTVVFFYKQILSFIKSKIYFIIIPLLALFLLLLTNIGLNKSLSDAQDDNPLKRINTTISVLGNLDKLVVEEGSLATRIISTINTVQATKTHPIIGIGYGNAQKLMFYQYTHTQTPLTLEIIDKSIKLDRCGPSPNIFWGLLLQSGIIGIFLLYTFFILSIVKAHKIKKYVLKKDQRILLQSMIYVAINYIIISFYWSFETYPMMWFVFAILNTFICAFNSGLKRGKLIYESK